MRNSYDSYLIDEETINRCAKELSRVGEDTVLVVCLLHDIPRCCNETGTCMLKVQNWLRFEGAVPPANVKDYMHAADLIALTKAVTNFGIHVMEAGMCGRCVVTLSDCTIARLAAL